MGRRQVVGVGVLSVNPSHSRQLQRRRLQEVGLVSRVASAQILRRWPQHMHCCTGARQAQKNTCGQTSHSSECTSTQPCSSKSILDCVRDSWLRFYIISAAHPSEVPGLPPCPSQLQVQLQAGTWSNEEHRQAFEYNGCSMRFSQVETAYSLANVN